MVCCNKGQILHSKVSCKKATKAYIITYGHKAKLCCSCSTGCSTTAQNVDMVYHNLVNDIACFQEKHIAFCIAVSKVTNFAHVKIPTKVTELPNLCFSPIWKCFIRFGELAPPTNMICISYAHVCSADNVLCRSHDTIHNKCNISPNKTTHLVLFTSVCSVR